MTQKKPPEKHQRRRWNIEPQHKIITSNIQTYTPWNPHLSIFSHLSHLNLARSQKNSLVIPLTCSLECFTKHFIEKNGYKMVLRQPTSRQQVGTLYEMTSPSSLWNASPQTTRVQKHAARHRATNQSFRLSTNARARVTVNARARWRNPDSTNASEPRFQPEVWRHNEEQERGDTTWENQWGKWCKMKNVTFMVCKQEKLLLYHSEMLKFVQIYLSIY